MLERDEKKRIRLSPKQAQFLLSKKRTVIYRGGIRSGKTVVLCLKAIEYAGKGLRFCLVSFTYPILRDVCMYTMREILRDAKRPFDEKSSDKVFIVNGTEIFSAPAISPTRCAACRSTASGSTRPASSGRGTSTT